MGTKVDQQVWGQPRVEIVASEWNPGLPGSHFSASLVSYRTRTGSSTSRSVAESFKKANGYMPVYSYKVFSGVGGLIPGSYEMLAVPGKPTTAGAFIRGTGMRMDLNENVLNTTTWANFSWDYSYVLPALMSARANANANVRDSSVSLAEDLAEMGQTTRMVTGLIRRLYRAIGFLRAGDFVSATRELGLKAVPKRIQAKYDRATWWSSWLALRYGWIPILSDIRAGVQLYNDRHAGKPRVVKVRGRANVTWNNNTSTVRQIRYDGSQIGYTKNYDNAYEATVETGYIYRITNPSLAVAKAWGIADPVSLAWELTTKSFLIDWVANVGDVLSQLGDWSGCEFLTGWESLQITAETTGYASDPVPWSPYFTMGTFTPAHCNWTVYRFERRVLTSAPPVTLVLQNNLTVKRVIDAIALLAIAAGERRKPPTSRRSF